MLYCDRISASNLFYTPDSTEYAIAAHRFATAGEYKIPIENRWLPPHYPPWFSILVLSPVYLLLGTEIGNAIYPVTIFSIGGIIIAFLLGKKIGGNWGGIFASFAVLALPLYRYWSKHVMTDVPATVLMLVACLLYLWFRNRTDTRSLAYLLPGIITAVAALFRPVCTAAILPFLVFAVTYRGLALALRKLVFLVTPLVIAATVSLTYNTSVFGSPFRSGYHFWMPVPFDFVHLTFSLSNIYTNLIALLQSHAVLLVCAACAVLAIECRINNMNTKQLPFSPDIRWVVEFVILGTGPIVLFHLLYFYLDPRFYLAPIVLTAIITGGIIGSWLKKKPRLALGGVIVLALLFIIINFFITLKYLLKPDQPSYKRFTVEEILKYTPKTHGLFPESSQFISNILWQNSLNVALCQFPVILNTLTRSSHQKRSRLYILHLNVGMMSSAMHCCVPAQRKQFSLLLRNSLTPSQLSLFKAQKFLLQQQISKLKTNRFWTN